jgi:hypothetical protein
MQVDLHLLIATNVGDSSSHVLTQSRAANQRPEDEQPFREVGHGSLSRQGYA